MASGVRGWLAQALVNLATRIEARPVDEDPLLLELAVLRTAERADSADAALRSVYEEVTRRLDDRTVHMVLLLLAGHVAHQPVLGAGAVRGWADDREFTLIWARLEQDDGDAP